MLETKCRAVRISHEIIFIPLTFIYIMNFKCRIPKIQQLDIDSKHSNHLKHLNDSLRFPETF
jgi:hypothetical protein